MSSLSCRRAASGAALLALAGVCLGQTGPDVIVGDLMSVARYGPVGTTYGYAVGTTSCNVGTANLSWIASTNQHPVIAQNLYRLDVDQGRFEQLGMTWLKHGFTALTQNLCDTCSGQGGSVLGVGCSDPYGATLNGSQSGMGPRSEVNASTGYFPYPPRRLGSGVDALSGRIRASTADLTVPNALYFVEGHYIAADDAAAGNDANNASYRRVTVDSGFALNTAGATQRTQPAIIAWRDHGLGVNQSDPGVTIETVDFAGDGRFLVGGKTSSNGDGTHHYEYAVQNLNSHNSGGSFVVPIPPGTVVTNAEFHGVNYDREPYDNQPWTITVSTNEVRFEVATPYNSSNDTGNALRWSTLYNFRFDADAPPGPSAVTLGLYRTSSSTVIPMQGPFGGVVNDNCVNPTSLGANDSTAPVDTTDATLDGPVDEGCGAASRDVWFRVTAPQAAGMLTLDTIGSDHDTIVSVYARNAGCADLGTSLLACGEGATGVAVRIAGQGAHLVRVASAAGQSGSVVLNSSFDGAGLELRAGRPVPVVGQTTVGIDEGVISATGATAPFAVDLYLQAMIVNDTTATGLSTFEGRFTDDGSGTFSPAQLHLYEENDGLAYLPGVTDVPSANTGMFPPFRATIGANNSDPGNGEQLTDVYRILPLSIAQTGEGGVGAPVTVYKLRWETSDLSARTVQLDVFSDGGAYQSTGGFVETRSVSGATVTIEFGACLCERDGDPTQVDVFDLLAYLVDWFAENAAADIDDVPGVDVFDLLTFLSCWFDASGGACG